MVKFFNKTEHLVKSSTGFCRGYAGRIQEALFILL